jgi:hypothetical protein
MKAASAELPSMHESEAYAALQRLVGHDRAGIGAGDEALNAMAMAGLDDLRRQLAKNLELRRYLGTQVELLAKRLAGGTAP